jgi:hypothetical protein
MKLIRTARLGFKKGTSDKVYEVDLCDVGSGRYVVNFRYGRRGGKLREGTKTTHPVSRNEAEEIFTSVVVSKTNKGYAEAGTDKPKVAASPAPAGSSPTEVLLARLVKPTKARRKLTRRTIWRVGTLRLREAVPALMALADNGDTLIQYGVAWALGRCGDPQAVPTLLGMQQQATDAPVQRMAEEAALALSADEGRRALVDSIIHDLPGEALRQALDDADALAAAIDAHLEGGEPRAFSVLERLYLLARDRPIARAVVLDWLDRAPLEPNYFQSIRHIFKRAEFREDGEVFGLLAWRFETTPAFFQRSHHGNYAKLPSGGSVRSVKQEIARPNARLAYSNRTRDYLRRRTWRTLRRLGQADDDAYVDMARGVLLPFTDEQAAEERHSEVYRWQSSRGRWNRVRVSATDYPPFAPYLAFNSILYANSPRYALAKSRRVWAKQRGGREPQGIREEAFPEIWDRHPQALVGLLTRSRCEPVHGFAATALQANPDYCAQLPVPTLAVFLRQPYTITARLGLELARARYDPQAPDRVLIEALLDAPMEEARRTGLAWTEAAGRRFLEDTDFLIRLLGSPFTEVRAWISARLVSLPLSDPQTEDLIARVLAQLLDLGTDDQASAVAKAMGTTLLNAFPRHMRRLGLDVIGDLLRHPLTELQVLAGRILLHHERPAKDLPPAIFKALLEAPAPEVQGLGVRLFGELPDPILRNRAELVSAFCVSELPEVRQAVRPAVQRLAAADQAYGRRLVDELLPYVFHKEPVAGFHRDLLDLLQTALAAALTTLDKGVIWRLLQAQSNAAQSLGTHLLPQMKPTDLTVRQWASLGGHPLLTVRQWVWSTYEAHAERIQAEPVDSLRLLDVDWEDSRQFGFAFFSQHFTDRDWTPELLVGICDSVRDDVQRFGRELITRFFEKRDGPAYLLKLSQHPSQNLQLFVTHYLERFATGQPERLEALVPYFVTVLSQVNRARTAKTRILAFLREEALKERQVALTVVRLLGRQSATIAITDKAACLETLRDIHQRFPDIPLPLQQKPVPLKGVRSNE